MRLCLGGKLMVGRKMALSHKFAVMGGEKR